MARSGRRSACAERLPGRWRQGVVLAATGLAILVNGGPASIGSAHAGIPATDAALSSSADPFADLDIDNLGAVPDAKLPPPKTARMPARRPGSSRSVSDSSAPSKRNETGGTASSQTSAVATKSDRLDAPKNGKGDLLPIGAKILDDVKGLDMGALPPANPALPGADALPYQLEIYINGQPTGLIAEVFRLPDGGWAMKAREMREVGLKPPAGSQDEDLVRLADIGADVTYDAPLQRLAITVDDSRRLPKVFDLAGGNRKEPLDVARPGTGLVLNYDLLVAGRTDGAFASASFEGFSANLDSWIYSPLGTLAGKGFLRVDAFGAARFVRLDTTWSYTDRARAMTYQVGDVVTHGPQWARSLRLGGVLAARNFRVRPDLITVPLPSLSATAAVPTTVDVYLNNIKVHSQQVPAGPFTISNIPAITNTGEARLVMQDAAGREIVASQRFYVSPSLLRAGLLDFSVAAGVARRGYGIASFDYDRDPVGMASFRYGLTHRVTVHGHMEAAQHLFLGGGGVYTSLMDRMVIGAAGAVSHSRFGTGFLAFGSLESRIGPLSLSATAQHTFGDYADLATLTASTATTAALNGAALTGTWMPEAMDTVTLGYRLPFASASLTLGYVHLKPKDGRSEHHLNVGYSQRLFGQASLYATAFTNLKKPKETSFFLGVSVPLGGNRGTASVGGAYDLTGRWRATASYARPLKPKDGSVGWRARATHGDLKSVEAALAWRTSKATLRAQAMRIENNTTARASVEGAIVVADGSMFASNRIHDSFAIVNVGAPDVTVRYENRPVGKTGRDGKLLLTTLRTHERNRISIAPEDLPVDARIPKTKAIVVPPQRSGVVVDFGVRQVSDAALVTLVDAAGQPLPAGVAVSVPGQNEPFLVGYDGQVYLEGLKAGAENEVTVDLGEDRACKARFRFTPKPGEMVFIGPVTCS